MKIFTIFLLGRFSLNYLNFFWLLYCTTSLLQTIITLGGTRRRNWLRHCTINRKVAGSIPDGVIGFFHWHIPSGRTMALGLTQPLTEMSTRNISRGVKAAGAYGWQPYHLHVLIVLKSGSLNLLEPSGPAQACNGIAFLMKYTKNKSCIILVFLYTIISRCTVNKTYNLVTAVLICYFDMKHDIKLTFV